MFHEKHAFALSQTQRILRCQLMTSIICHLSTGVFLRFFMKHTFLQDSEKSVSQTLQNIRPERKGMILWQKKRPESLWIMMR